MPLNTVLNSKIYDVKEPVAVDWPNFNFGFEPSQDQKEIINYIFENPDQNIIVNNVAGSGKTTMFSMIERIIDKYKPQVNRYYLTFSKELSEDNKKKINNNNVRTIHSMAYGIIMAFMKANRIKINRKGFINDKLTNNFVFNEIIERMPNWRESRATKRLFSITISNVLDII
ncbi:MAG: hypothetical protein KC414_09130, partial [Romboutsia sp.]|nr:hypothetical protein [Romboutsia sp.]